MSLRIFGGIFKSRILKSPPSSSTRPTQGILRQAVFNICQQDDENALFLDLFAGSGAIGLEALSRGAAFAVFVEQNPAAARCIRENIRIWGSKKIKTLCLQRVPALRHLSKLPFAFDLIYIDPPYAQGPQKHPSSLAELEELKSDCPAWKSLCGNSLRRSGNRSMIPLP